MNWFGKFTLTVFISFCCMVGALGARYPLSVLLVLLAKGCWVLFVVAFFWDRDKRRRRRKEFEDFMRWRDRRR
jgi:Flp pilus assembly protein TadB